MNNYVKAFLIVTALHAGLFAGFHFFPGVMTYALPAAMLVGALAIADKWFEKKGAK